MIDSVRTTVLAVLNKNNYGYLSPMDFNLYAKQAQLEIFENLFYNYNSQINLENLRKSGSEYANISKGILEDIDIFSKVSTLTYSVDTFALPSDYYFINKVLCYSNGVLKSEAERVSQSKITALNMSPLTAPSVDFPAYTQTGSSINVFPTSFNSSGDVQAQYIRYPQAPKWTYTSISGNAPIFNPTAGDYQDFELPDSYENDLVMKILQYAGVEIREDMVYKFAKTEEQENNIEQQ